MNSLSSSEERKTNFTPNLIKKKNHKSMAKLLPPAKLN